MSWRVVIFLEENSIEAIPLNWIIEDIAYWPPFRGFKLKNAITKCEEPSLQWSQCKVRILGSLIYDDYNEACRQAKKGEYTSDLNSTDNEAPRIRKKVQYSTSEEEISEDDTNIPIPSHLSFCKERPGPSSMNEPPKRVINKSHVQSCKPQPLEKTAAKETCNCASLKLLMTKQFSMIYTKIEDIALDIAQIKLGLEEKRPLSEKYTSFTYDLPIKTEDELLEFEKYITEEENYKNFVHFIIKIGGSSSYDCVKRSMSRIMTNELANKFSWIGAKGKKAFYSLKVSKGIIAGISEGTYTKNCPEKNIEDNIKTWLRHAHERLVKEQSRKSKSINSYES